jgi:hypothetical protein
MGIRSSGGIRILRKPTAGGREIIATHRGPRNPIDYGEIDFGTIDMPKLRPGNKKLAAALTSALEPEDIVLLRKLAPEAIEGSKLQFQSKNFQRLLDDGLMECEPRKILVDNPNYDDYKFQHEEDLEELESWIQMELANARTQEDEEYLERVYLAEKRHIGDFYSMDIAAKIEKSVNFYKLGNTGKKLLHYLDKIEKMDAGRLNCYVPDYVRAPESPEMLSATATVRGKKIIQWLTRTQNNNYVRSYSSEDSKRLDRNPTMSKEDTESLRTSLRTFDENRERLSMVAPVLYGASHVFLTAQNGELTQISRDVFDVADRYIRNGYFFATDGDNLALMNDKQELLLLFPGVAASNAESFVRKQFDYFYGK